MATRTQIEINGKNISCLKSGTGENVILFLHGNGMSAENWLPQLDDEELRKRYTLIAVDLPGHGKSDWANGDKSWYHPRNISKLIKPLLDKCNAKSYLLVGLSFGTNVIGEMAPPLHGCKGIMLVSTCILNNANLPSHIITPGQYGHVIASPHPTDEDLKAFVHEHMKNKKISEQYIIDYRNADPAFREELYKMMVESSWMDELANIKAWNLPVCIVFGKNDSLLTINYLDNFTPVWNNHVYVIDNSRHFPNEEQSEIFNELLSTYADERFK